MSMCERKSLEEKRRVRAARKKMMAKIKAFDDEFGNLDSMFGETPIKGCFLTQAYAE